MDSYNNNMELKLNIFVMAATSVDKNNGEKSMMEVTRVDKNSKVKFSMSDYEIANLGTFTIPTEKETEQK